MQDDASNVHQRSSPARKIALFRALFRGREDVYPRRFESRRTGKSGYQPACANEWVRGVCDKPKVKCAECPHRRFLPVTNEAIRWHLSGRDAQDRDFVMGVYPMLQDETCFFLAADFDKADWREDAAAVLQTCRRLELPAALERSRSGNGAGEFKDVKQACAATTRVIDETKPDRKAARYYDRAYAVYRDLYPSLKDDFKAIAGLEG